MELEQYLRARNALYRGNNATMRRINAEYDEILYTITATGRGSIARAINDRAIAVEAAYAKLDAALNNLKTMYRDALESREVSNV